MKPDIIVCIPKDIYPKAFIKRVNRDRDLFNKVIIAITNQELPIDYSNEIKGNIKEPTILTKFEQSGDWRNNAIQKCLESSNSEYILFLEPDFFVADGFFKEIFSNMNGVDIVGFEDGNRFHPSCLLIKREILDKTSKDFSAYPQEYDHFGVLTQELKKLGTWKNLPEKGWYHMASFVFNKRIDMKDGKIGYRPDEFKLYKLLEELI